MTTIACREIEAKVPTDRKQLPNSARKDAAHEKIHPTKRFYFTLVTMSTDTSNWKNIFSP
jgi:hypothetical protein